MRDETETGYNGWTNYETWLVALWIDNEEPTYLESRRILRDAIRDAGEEWDEASDNAICRILKREKWIRGRGCDALKDWAEDAMLPDLEGFAGDLVRSAWGEIDWADIYDSWAEECAEVAAS